MNKERMTKRKKLREYPSEVNCLDRDEIIKRLCRLQEEVFDLVGAQHPSDCICGTGGFWGARYYDGRHENGFRNDGACLLFIEKAVRDAIKREVLPKPRKGRK